MTSDMTQLTLPAVLENLASFQDFISKAAETAKISQARIGKLALASEEALVNIFSYAYPEGGTGNVTVTCIDNGDETFSIRFEDQGQPFNMLSVDDPDTALSIDDRDIGGLGIFFIKQMTDSVEYERKDEMNILTLIFSGE
ncbi:MAG: ATP-binding protein [Desulfobacterales bacterium]|nr:ATP-binding protein [Desulfobacterales bacterium]